VWSGHPKTSVWRGFRLPAPGLFWLTVGVGDTRCRWHSGSRSCQCPAVILKFKSGGGCVGQFAFLTSESWYHSIIILRSPNHWSQSFRAFLSDQSLNSWRKWWKISKFHRCTPISTATSNVVVVLETKPYTLCIRMRMELARCRPIW